MKRKEKLNEYRGSSEEQLGLSLSELEKNLFHLRFQSATDRLETPSQIRKARRQGLKWARRRRIAYHRKHGKETRP